MSRYLPVHELSYSVAWSKRKPVLTHNITTFTDFYVDVKNTLKTQMTLTSLSLGLSLGPMSRNGIFVTILDSDGNPVCEKQHRTKISYDDVKESNVISGEHLFETTILLDPGESYKFKVQIEYASGENDIVSASFYTFGVEHEKC